MKLVTRLFASIGLLVAAAVAGSIIAADVLYLKVGATNRPDYERAGMHPFKPYPDRAGTMQYCAVPLDVLESGLELTVWARKAVDVAERSKVSR